MESRAACQSSSCIASWLAVGVCAAMASLYVGLLYVPSVLLRLPPPSSLRNHILRRFAGATVATCFSLFLSYCVLVSVKPKSSEGEGLKLWLNAFGICSLHWFKAITLPLFLTAFLYLGPLVLSAIEVYDDWQEGNPERLDGANCSRHRLWGWLYGVKLLAFDILAWRNYFMAPLTEEVVFRASMIPILLCAGFQPVAVIFLCPLFFGLAHVNHFWELIHYQNLEKRRAFLIVASQLGYTTVFGWYACFLFIRTGNILAPFTAHTFCNIMGFPDLPGVFQRKGLVFIFVVGILGFSYMLMPLTSPILYKNPSTACYCWLGYCKWK